MDGRLWRLVAALALATAVAACGGGDDDGDDGGLADAAESAGPDDSGDSGGGEDSGGDKEIDGCALLTEADAEALLGEPVERQPDDGLGGDAVAGECTWIVETETSFKMVLLHVFAGPQFYAPEIYEAEEGFEEIEGLGDDAFLWGSDLGLDLQMLVDDHTIALGASGFNVDDPGFTAEAVRQGLLDIAEKVVDRF